MSVSKESPYEESIVPDTIVRNASRLEAAAPDSLGEKGMEDVDAAAAAAADDEEFLDNPDLFPDGGTKANIVVVGAFIGFIGTLGFVNSTGVLQSYISENILPHTSEASIGWIFSIYNFMSFGMTLISGAVFDNIGCRVPLSAGIVMQVVGFMCFSVSTELYQIILSYSILGGLGTCFTFAPFVGVVSHWFLRKRAQAIGIAYVGGAIGGIIFPLVFRSLFKKVGFGWTIRIATFMVLAFLSIGWLLVRDRLEELNGKREEGSGKARSIVKEIIKSIDFTVFTDKVYTCLVLALLGNGFAFLISLAYIPSYAIANGASESHAYLLMVVFNSMSIPGRIIPGIFADIYGRFNTLCVISSLSTIAFFVVWVPPPVGHKLVGIYIFSGIYGFTSGSVLSLSPACIGQICQTKDFGKRAGTAFFALSFGDLVGIPIGGAIIGKSQSVTGFNHLVLFIAFLSLAGTVSAYGSRFLYKGFNLMRV